MNTYGSIDQSDTKHSYPPNHENHENHTKQTAPQPCFPLQQTPLLPLKNLHLHHHHAPSPPFLHINHHPLQQPIHAHLHSPNPKTQPNQPFFHSLPQAITKTLSLPPPPTPASIPNPAHSILKDNSSANHSFASPRRRFHRILNFPGLSGGVVDDVDRGLGVL